MSIKSISDSMSLGVIIVNDKPYLAILHFNEARPITEQMKRTSAVSLTLFQDVLNKFQSEEYSLINRVNKDGFLRDSELIKTHTELKSEDAWKKFIASIESPIPADALEELSNEIGIELAENDEEERKRAIELFKDVDKNQFAKDLYNKIKEEKFELTDQERLFLKYAAFYNSTCYSKLIKNEYDVMQLGNLQLEF